MHDLHWFEGAQFSSVEAEVIQDDIIARVTVYPGGFSQGNRVALKVAFYSVYFLVMRVKVRCVDVCKLTLDPWSEVRETDASHVLADEVFDAVLVGVDSHLKFIRGDGEATGCFEKPVQIPTYLPPPNFVVSIANSSVGDFGLDVDLPYLYPGFEAYGCWVQDHERGSKCIGR